MFVGLRYESCLWSMHASKHLKVHKIYHNILLVFYAMCYDSALMGAATNITFTVIKKPENRAKRTTGHFACKRRN